MPVLTGAAPAQEDGGRAGGGSPTARAPRQEAGEQARGALGDRLQQGHLSTRGGGHKGGWELPGMGEMLRILISVQVTSVKTNLHLLPVCFVCVN